MGHAPGRTRKQIAQSVEGKLDDQEMAATQGGLQVPGWAVGVQGLPSCFDFSNPNRPHQRVNEFAPTEEHFVL